MSDFTTNSNTNSNTNKTYDIVMFHYPCQDGLASAWVAHNAHKEQGLQIALYPIAHGKPIDIEMFVGKRVIICDYAPSSEVLEQLEQVVQSIQILDHHVTARDALANKPYALFDMTRSGAGLTWDWFYPETPMPDFIRMIQDRDLWKWVVPGSKEFTAGLFTMCSTVEHMDFDELFKLFEPMYQDPGKISFYMELGKIISTLTENKARALGDDHMGTITPFAFGGKLYRACVANCFPDIASEAGNYISKSDQIDFAVLWRYHNPSKDFYVSLRSTGNIDVSAIAKSFGGGGHANAAGFSTRVFPPTLFDNVNYSNANLE